MGEKRCSSCKEVKPLDEFNRLAKAKDGRQWNCRECNRKWHAENKARHNAKIHDRARSHRLSLKIALLSYLASHPCVDCGETNPVVLEFDHLRDKLHNVTGLINRAKDWATIAKEIEKCEVVCANCHRMRTAARARNFRWRFARGPFEGLVGRVGLEPTTTTA